MKNEFSFGFENRSFALWIKILFFIQNVVSLFLGGEKCLRCSRKTVRIPLCHHCIHVLNSGGFKKSCSKCGRELLSEIGVCSSCRESPVLKSVDSSYSLHGYQLWKKSLLFAWKLEDKRNLSVYFAAIFYRKLKEIEMEKGSPVCVVPVPPRNGKIRERGWDQIDELCYYLKKGWNVKVFYLLERLSKIQQKKLDREQRLGNITGSYRLKKSKKMERIIKNLPEIVVLIDDVLTTGSTVEACAHELKKIGIKQVLSLTLFIVD